MRRRPTRRALIVVLVGLLLFGAGATAQAGWLFVLAAATPAAYGDPVITDETLEQLDLDVGYRYFTAPDLDTALEGIGEAHAAANEETPGFIGRASALIGAVRPVDGGLSVIRADHILHGRIS